MAKTAVVLFVAAHPARALSSLMTSWLGLHLSHKVRRDGLDIHAAEYIDEAEDVIAKVGAALRLIDEVCPKRYRRMQRDLRRILVSDVGSSSYWFEASMCVLDLQLVRKKSDGTLALVLVHEATHARLYRAGIPTWRSIQARVERVCVQEQIAFATQLGEAGWGRTAETIAALERALTDPWWTEARQFENRLRSLTDSDLPRWVVRTWAWWCRPRTVGRE